MCPSDVDVLIRRALAVTPPDHEELATRIMARLDKAGLNPSEIAELNDQG
jgi:hypothetical protein